MNITSNYQIHSVNFGANLEPAKKLAKKITIPSDLKNAVNNVINKEGAKALAAGALVTAAGTLAINQIKKQEAQTIYGPVIYTPKGKGEKSSLVVSRPNGAIMDIFKDIPQATLESPVIEHLHQVKASTINPKVGIVLIQNQSAPVVARKVVTEGTLEDSMVRNNMTNVPVKYSLDADSMYTDTPWNPGIQYANQRCFQVTYGTVREDWGARAEYIAEYADPITGEAPDVAILAAQKGTDDRSFVPADVAKGQYEIVLENGERIPCDYDNTVEGVNYSISKKSGVELKMAVPSEAVISSEGENLEADKLYMVDSMGHFYNGNPIKRIKSGEVTWNADMNNPIQKTIRGYIDESLKLEAKAKAAKKEGNKELANKLSADAKSLTQMAEQAMTKWVKSAQNPEGVNFFAE